MNLAHHYSEIKRLWAEIAQLEEEIVALERQAREMTGDEIECALAQARLDEAHALMDHKRREHGIRAHFLALAMEPKDASARAA